MPGLVPGIHVLVSARKHVDGRDKPGHDDTEIQTLTSRKPIERQLQRLDLHLAELDHASTVLQGKRTAGMF